MTITDRTRTAVLGLSGGSPVIALAAHRELEGLLRSMGLADCCVLPRPGFSLALGPLLDRLLDDVVPVRRAVRRALPDMVALAMTNLEGLPRGRAAVQPARLLG